MRDHAHFGTKQKERLPVSWDKLRPTKKSSVQLGVGWKVLWLCLGVSYFFLTCPGKIFADNNKAEWKSSIPFSVVMSLSSGNEQLGFLRRREADCCVEDRFRESKADQVLRGAEISRFREKQVSQGSLLDVGSGGGTRALTVELVSCHPGLSRNAPRSAFMQT